MAAATMSERKKWNVLWLKAVALMRKVHIPGFRGMDAYSVARFFFRGLSDPKFTLIASALAYQFFFSLIPSLLLVFVVIPWFPVKGLRDGVVQFIADILPEQFMGAEGLELVQTQVGAYFANPPSFWLFLVGLFLAFWGATRGIIGLMKAFTKDDEAFKRRNIWQLYGTSMVIFFVLGGIIIVSVTLQITFVQLVAWLEYEYDLAKEWAGLIRTGVILLLTSFTVFLLVAALYRLAPATHTRWKIFSPGANFAGLLTIAAIWGLRYFFANFANYDRIYGSLAAIIVMLVWFYYISIVLLLGFELNAAIELASWRQGESELPPAIDTPGDTSQLASEESLQNPAKG
ncbi:MAG: YihY/virulence factor BrkB family protein [Bacteroidia bacterium]|nr:YihY/virulence factor BrkB family protein [Bacteroidia bacterium]